MSYMRGDYYLWQDGTKVHFWIRDGYDFWDETIWYEDENRKETEIKPSGVAIPIEIADEYVVMRLAQLLETGMLPQTVDRAIEKWESNIGCHSLVKIADRLKSQN